MTSLTLVLCGLIVAMTMTSGASSDVTSRREDQLRHIRSSLARHLRALQAKAGKGRRFVGQLATDCGMDCKEGRGVDTPNTQAKRVVDRVQESKMAALRKRFMSLGAADCGSFECVLKKREAQEKVKRLLAGKDERATLVHDESSRGRYKRYIDLILGNPYDQPESPSKPWENNYGSNGWNYYNNDYRNDYYDYSDYYYDYSGSGNGGDAEEGGDDTE